MLNDFRAFSLARDFYQRCKLLKLPPFLRDQLLRAASSTALNLAESAGGKQTEKEQIRFFTISMGSFRECQAILELEQIQDPLLKDISNQLGAILYRLCRLDRRRNTDLKSNSINTRQVPSMGRQVGCENPTSGPSKSESSDFIPEENEI